MQKIIKGKVGEAIAYSYLKKHRYKMVEKNFKTSAGEIDLIVTDKKYLVFVEVKMRSSLSMGYPREAVNNYKQNKIKLVAMQYLKLHSIINVPVRFDVIEIVGDEHNYTIEHFVNAF